MPTTLHELWTAFVAERSISLCPTSLTSDYNQVSKWLERCPIQNIEEARKVMIWVLGEKPVLSSRRVAMYTKTMYRWAAQEDVGYLPKNPLASFKMPKAPQKDEEIVVGWVKEKFGDEKVAEIEAALQSQLDEKHAPSRQAGVPWSN